MMDRSIGDDELDGIEIEAEGYELENFPISGVQLSGIIQRLRMAEARAHAAMPFMLSHRTRARDARCAEAWAFPRLGVMILACGGGVVGGWAGWNLIGARMAITETSDILLVGFGALSFMVPMAAIGLPLLAWIDRLASRRAATGAYDVDE